MSQKPVYTAVVEANRRAQREVAISLGRTLKSEQGKQGQHTVVVVSTNPK